MKIYENKSQFGWHEDNGIGDLLINQILSGVKTATAAPKTMYSADELKSLYSSVGQPFTVIDKHEQPRCNILLTNIFETTFGSPDAKLLAGEGHENDPEEFKRVHRIALADLVESGKLTLNDETVFIVELFRLIQD